VAARHKAAKRRGKDLARSYEFWFRQKYSLPPTDPRFLAMTSEDVEAEYWACHYEKNGDQEEYEDDDFDAAIASLDDDNADDWEEVINDH